MYPSPQIPRKKASPAHWAVVSISLANQGKSSRSSTPSWAQVQLFSTSPVSVLSRESPVPSPAKTPRGLPAAAQYRKGVTQLPSRAARAVSRPFRGFPASGSVLVSSHTGRVWLIPWPSR